MNTYIWLIDSMECVPSSNGQTNVVSIVHWRVNATDGKNICGTYGVQPLTYTAENPFTAYSALTQDDVISWVQTAMGAEQVTAIQDNLDKQLKNLTNPPVITLPLPWSE